MPTVLRPGVPGMPPPTTADRHGIVALGGDLSEERLLLAYRTGIFPWYSEGLPIQWHSPDPRMVLEVDSFHVGRSLRKRLRRRPYRLTLDRAFADVIAHCAAVRRRGQWGTWITNEMIAAYCKLHDSGWAHSVEAWDGDRLVGGLYGVAIGSMFCGESMFALAPDASKVAFAHFVPQLQRWGTELVDCQVHTDHLERFGAVQWPRSRFLDRLAECRAAPTRRGKWTFDPDLFEEVAARTDEADGSKGRP